MAEGRVRLTKGSPKVSFLLEQIFKGEFQIDLEWRRSGFDADLIVFYRTKRGRIGVIQALGNAFGSRHGLPHIELLNDDRRGGKGEVAVGNVEGIFRDLEWIGIAVYLYGSRAPLCMVRGAKTTIRLPGLPAIEVKHRGGLTNTCAILSATIDDKGFHVVRHMRSLWRLVFLDSHRRLSRFWGLDINWKPGRK